MSYDRPRLRKRIVREVLAGDKGGAPNQWTARKAQLARQRYEAAGGGYTGPKTAAQKKLTRWTGERWTTRTGEPASSRDSSGKKVMRRYLPADVWQALSKSEAAATDRKKIKGSREGKKRVANTQKARAAKKAKK
jgi:hypothetical protein